MTLYALDDRIMCGREFHKRLLSILPQAKCNTLSNAAHWFEQIRGIVAWTVILHSDPRPGPRSTSSSINQPVKSNKAKRLCQKRQHIFIFYFYIQFHNTTLFIFATSFRFSLIPSICFDLCNYLFQAQCDLPSLLWVCKFAISYYKVPNSAVMGWSVTGMHGMWAFKRVSRAINDTFIYA